MKKSTVLVAVSIFAGAVFFTGCSNTATDEEMAQLAKLRSEITSLESQLSKAQGDKSDLQKQLADRDDKLKQCQADQEEYKKATGK